MDALRLVRALMLAALLCMSESALAADDAWSPAQFDACLKALDGHVSMSPLIGDAGKYFALRSPFVAGRNWNVGQPHRPNSINILIPAAKANWPEACGPAPGVRPSCWSYPSLSEVICNPAMGAYIEELPQGGPFDPIYILAGKYFFYFVLGHELGHLMKEATFRRSHFDNALRVTQLRCYPKIQNKENLEAEADNAGAALACGAVIDEKSAARIEFSASSDAQFNLYTKVQARLYEYQISDDLCLGDSSYDSFSIRTQIVSEKMLDCVAGEHPVPRLAAKEFGGSLLVAEDMLRDRQMYGWPGSPDYGSSRPSYWRIVEHSTAHLFLAIEDDDSEAKLTIVKAVPGEDPKMMRIDLPKRRVVDLLGNVSVANGWSIYLRSDTAKSTRVERIDIGCKNLAQMKDCTGHVGRGALLRFEDQLDHSDDAPTVVRRSSVDFFRNFDDLLAGNRPAASLRKSKHDLAAIISLQHGSSKYGYIGPSDAAGVAPLTVGQIARHDNQIVELDVGTGTISATTQRGGMLFVALETRAIDLPVFVPNHLSVCPLPNGHRKAHTGIHCTRYAVPEPMKAPLSLAQFVPDNLQAPRIRALTTECGELLVWSAYGWSWIVDLKNARQTVVPAEGVARCTETFLLTYRAGRLDELEHRWTVLKPM
ncbi:hypothetical protein [Paraburkholderia caribensis]|uniref:hypothetical protein n=1 Tax=Paraburkholderia caribensis TaxID=75105 RepID=UPI0034D25D0F